MMATKKMATNDQHVDSAGDAIATPVIAKSGRGETGRGETARRETGPRERR
jgi:hypothetical protein